jgi:hypothetical protein
MKQFIHNYRLNSTQNINHNLADMLKIVGASFKCHRQNPHCKLLGGYKSRRSLTDVLCRPSLQKIIIFYCVKETIAQECVGGDFWMHHYRSAFEGIQHEPQFPAIQIS